MKIKNNLKQNETFFVHKNMKKPSSKVAHNRPYFFSTAPRIENSFQKFVSGTLCYIYFVIPIQVVISFGKMQVNVFIRELTSDALNFVVNTVLTQ